MVGKQLDLRGRICPEPYIVVMRIFTDMKKGEELVALMDSWRCVVMVAEALRVSKMGKVDIEKKDNYYELKIVRVS